MKVSFNAQFLVLLSNIIASFKNVNMLNTIFGAYRELN